MYNRILQFISTRIASYFQIVRECLYLKTGYSDVIQLF